MTSETFDFIVVGGGSAGCVAAARLVTEGGAPRAAARGRTFPSSSAARHAARHLQDDQRQQVHALPSRRCRRNISTAASHDIPQANVLGGGSSVNAQVYMRGRPVRLRRVARAAARRQRRCGLALDQTCCRIFGHGGQQPAERRAARRGRPAAGLRSRPYRRFVALVRAGRAGPGRAATTTISTGRSSAASASTSS